jgi:hypothetical protein
MKHLLLICLLSASLDGFSQACQHNLPNCKCLRISDTVVVAKPDTTCESMHLSTRDQGFVISRKALSVRINGICVQHLQSNGRPFPVHYRVGWCEGREEVWERLVKLLNEK